jgi:hypothetical protein
MRSIRRTQVAVRLGGYVWVRIGINSGVQRKRLDLKPECGVWEGGVLSFRIISFRRMQNYQPANVEYWIRRIGIRRSGR